MILSSMANVLPGKVKFIFQPDEEDTGGGGRLCERGVLESERGWWIDLGNEPPR